MALTAPHEAAVVMTANSAELQDAEADLLALHVAAGRAPSRGEEVGLPRASAQ